MEASGFMLIGFSLRGVLDRVGGFGVVIEEMAIPIALILVTLTFARFVWVFGSDGVIALLRATGVRRYKPLGPRAATVLSWAGMRGVVTLAVALSVPADFPGRDFMLVTAFAVILGTVLIQGNSLGALIRWAGLREPDSDLARMTMSQAEASMAQAQIRVVERHAYDDEGNLVHPRLLDSYQRKATISADYAGQEAQYAPLLHAHFDLILAANAAGRSELLRLYRAGDIDEDTLHELERDLDLEELSARSAKA